MPPKTALSRLQATRAGFWRRRTVGLGMAFTALYLAVAILAAPWAEPDRLHPLALAVLAGGLISLSVADLQTWRLPDGLTLPLTALGIALAPLLHASMSWQAASAGVGFAALWGVAWAYRAVRGSDGLGLGDAKLLAAAGAWLGLESLPTVLLWAAVGGLVMFAVRHLCGRRVPSGSDGVPAGAIAFGPFLAGAVWLVWFTGPL